MRGQFSATIENYEVQFFEDKKGNLKKIKIAIEPWHIWSKLDELTDGRIKRVGNKVFGAGEDRIVYFDCANTLFGWFASQNLRVDWATIPSAITKGEFLAYLKKVAHPHKFACSLPHFPAVKDYYYINHIEPNQTGKLEELVSFFKPATTEDRALIKAAFATLFWGGDFGSRPAFLIDGVEGDIHGNRGIGKTAITDTASVLSGGHIDCSKKTESVDLNKALVNSDDRRIVRFDNIKNGTLSHEGLESLITCQEVSGHRMYFGSDSIPNWFTYFLTFNDAILSKDLAQRCMVIRLARPEYDADWLPSLMAFIRTHQKEIIADIGYLLSQTSDFKSCKTRFPNWEKEVLSKVADDIATVQKKIISDQGLVDDEAHMRDEIASLVLQKIDGYKHNFDESLEEATVAIPQSLLMQWIAPLFEKEAGMRVKKKRFDQCMPKAFLSETRMHRGCAHYLWVAKRNQNPADFSFVPTHAWRIKQHGGATVWPFKLF